MTLRVSVDKQCCGVIGYCSRIAPEVFDTTSGEVATVIQDTIDDRDLAASVAEAEAICPTAAIAVVEERAPSRQDSTSLPR